MQRYKIKFEYDGSDFHGWQEQKGLVSVQETIQTAIENFSGEVVTVHGAGRTDAGVHALGQVAHFDLNNHKPSNEVCSALNHFLKNKKIAILEAVEVGQDFHARFSAKSRSYIYIIINRKAHLTTQQGLAWHIPEKLDENLMHAAAQHLTGLHDLASFRSSQCQAKSSVKSIDVIEVERYDERIEIFIKARSFLHNQVRIIVGTLRKIGNASWHPNKIQQILAARNRSAAGQTAPPYGLYLSGVEYSYF
jgi:tRNA pseudouridine38-40 synthase